MCPHLLSVHLETQLFCDLLPLVGILVIESHHHLMLFHRPPASTLLVGVQSLPLLFALRGISCCHLVGDLLPVGKLVHRFLQTRHLVVLPTTSLQITKVINTHCSGPFQYATVMLTTLSLGAIGRQFYCSERVITTTARYLFPVATVVLLHQRYEFLVLALRPLIVVSFPLGSRLLSRLLSSYIWLCLG